MTDVRDLPRDQLVVVPLAVMQAIASYLAHRPYVDVAPLAADLQQFTTLKEFLARKKPEAA